MKVIESNSDVTKFNLKDGLQLRKSRIWIHFGCHALDRLQTERQVANPPPH